MTEQHSWQTLTGRNRHKEATFSLFLIQSWDRREKREAANCVASGPRVLSLSDTCASIDTCREHGAFSVSSCHFSPLWLLLSSGWLTDDRADKDEFWEEGNKNRVHIKGCRCWLHLYNLYSPQKRGVELHFVWIWTNTGLCVSLPVSSPSLSLRLGVSQCVPGVRCIRRVCCLAGSSVWRLHLVPAQNGKLNCISTHFKKHLSDRCRPKEGINVKWCRWISWVLKVVGMIIISIFCGQLGKKTWVKYT